MIPFTDVYAEVMKSALNGKWSTNTETACAFQWYFIEAEWRVGNLTITGSNNGLSPGQRQTIIWTNAGILLIGH